jgi:hypothetical protein
MESSKCTQIGPNRPNPVASREGKSTPKVPQLVSSSNHKTGYNASSNLQNQGKLGPSAVWTSVAAHSAWNPHVRMPRHLSLSPLLSQLSPRLGGQAGRRVGEEADGARRERRRFGGRWAGGSAAAGRRQAERRRPPHAMDDDGDDGLAIPIPLPVGVIRLRSLLSPLLSSLCPLNGRCRQPPAGAA